MAKVIASVDEELIRLRAFELWQARGCPVGSPEDDWFTAKRQLEAEVESRAPAVTTRAGEPERAKASRRKASRLEEPDEAREPAGGPPQAVMTPRTAAPASDAELPLGLRISTKSR